MKGAEYPSIQAIDGTLESARKKLPYIYFHNFVASEWVHTLCPDCGCTVIERFSLGCGGDKLKRLLCADNRCPDCGRTINILSQKPCPGNMERVQQ